MTMRVWNLASLAVAVATMSGCVGGSGDGNNSGNVCARAASKLRSCGLATEGVFAGCDEPEGAEESCEASCLLNAACADLEAEFCGSTTPPTLEACTDNCETQHAFACGGGETVSQNSACDGFQDCSTGADEEGCPTFDCGNGQTIAAGAECDGFPHCSNSADETSCMTQLFTCDNGQMIDASWECDGDTDCSDASDEAACPAALDLICN